MTEPNGWHHNERVYIQARHMGDVLVQYTDRAVIPGMQMMDRPVGRSFQRQPIRPWAWVPVADVIWDWELRESA